MSENQTLQYQSIPQNKLQSKALTNWSPSDLWVLSVILLIMTSSAIWLHVVANDGIAFWAVMFEAAILLPLLVRRPKSYEGRLYAQLHSALRSIVIQVVLKGVIWSVENTGNWFVRFTRSRLFPHGPLNLVLAQISATIEKETFRYGIIRQLDRPYDHLIVVSDGANFATQDVNAQHHATSELADICNETIAKAGLKVGFSLQRISGPYDESRVLEYFGKASDPLVSSPELFQTKDPKLDKWSEWRRKNAELLLPTAKQHGASKSWYLIMISIKRKTQINRASRGKASDEELYDLPIIELGRSLVESLESSTRLGMKKVRIASLAELAMIVRCSWDVTGIEDYFERRAKGKIPRTDEEIELIRKDHGDAAVDKALEAWPQRKIKIADGGKGIWFDENYITVRRVTELPRQVRADQFRLLHELPAPNVWTRQGMVGESASGNTETQSLIYTQSALLNINAAFKGRHLVQNPKFARKQRELARQTEMASAFSITQYFNMFHTVIAPTERNGDLSRNSISAKFTAMGYPSQVISTPDKLTDAAISGCLGINRF